MDVDRYLNLSEDLISAALPKGAINGIAIDNPSGSWLLVEPIHLFVPPYTSGWQNPVSNAFSVSVTWVDSPSGSKSNPVILTGEQVRVHLSGNTLEHSDGFPSGAGARVNIIPPTETVITLVACGYHGGAPNPPTTVLTATALERLVIRRLSYLAELAASNELALNPILLCSTDVIWQISPALTFEWRQGIPAEGIYVTDTIEDGAIIIPPGSSLEITAFVESDFVMEFAFPGSPGVNILAQAQFYRETVVV